jgi:sugar (pentulose or hexulose) kinase
MMRPIVSRDGHARIPESTRVAVRRGWAERLAPLTPANSVLGTLRPEWAAASGLSRRVEVYCGMHDSNAALLAARSHPELEGHDATVLSTGTWFVAMRTPNTNDAVQAALRRRWHICTRQ